jgi:hypothetical protein
MTEEQAILSDLAKCDLGLAVTRGALRARYAAHRAACMDALRAMNRRDGLDTLTPAEILAELNA